MFDKAFKRNDFYVDGNKISVTVFNRWTEDSAIDVRFHCASYQHAESLSERFALMPVNIFTEAPDEQDKPLPKPPPKPPQDRDPAGKPVGNPVGNPEPQARSWMRIPIVGMPIKKDDFRSDTYSVGDWIEFIKFDKDRDACEYIMAEIIYVGLTLHTNKGCCEPGKVTKHVTKNHVRER